jgi:hypothetical protein
VNEFLVRDLFLFFIFSFLKMTFFDVFGGSDFRFLVVLEVSQSMSG